MKGENLETELTESILWNIIVHDVDICMFWKDKNRKFVGANKAFLDFYGLELKDIVGKNDEEMGWHPEPDFFKQEELKVLSGEPIKNDEGVCYIRGKIRNIIASKIPIYNNDKKVIGLFGYFADETDRLTEINRLKIDATIDPLTKLLNRRGLDEEVEKYVNRYNETYHNFVIYYMDIDSFKDFNDTFGHDVGDMILLKVASQLMHTFSINASISRVGGDEFVILKPLDNLEDIEIDKEKIYKAYSDIHDIEQHLEGIQIKTSIGHAIYTETNDVPSMIRLADERMYKEKRKHHLLRHKGEY